MLKELIYIILVGVFANNYVLQQTTGICPFLGVSKKFDQAAEERSCLQIRQQV